jgi:hypothetical protein
MSEPVTLAPVALDERRMAESILARAHKIVRWTNSATLHTRRSAKDEIPKVIKELQNLYGVL